MGEANRLREGGIQFKQLRPGEQIQVDLKNALPKICEKCGCEIFTTAIKVFTVSAIVSPTGQEIVAQQPVLVCLKCKEVLPLTS